jgi:hypothetical protein
MAYAVDVSLGLIAYFAAVLLISFIPLRRCKENKLRYGLMVGVAYGFVNSALANIAKGIYVLHDVLELPSDFFIPLNIDPANLMLYSVPYIIFWVVVFAAVAKLAGRKRGDVGEEE